MIRRQALAWCVARASVAEIDALNILEASMLAMQRAVAGLSPQPGFVLVDGNRLPRWRYASEPVVKGDDRVPAIAAASILAKVQRDGELVALEERYPGYGFARHKGYGTPQHQAALAALGPSATHRFSFAPLQRLRSRVANGEDGRATSAQPGAGSPIPNPEPGGKHDPG